MTGRAIVAIALLVGFYVLALAVIALLIWIPYAEWTYLGRIHFRLVLVCGLAAFAVLVGMAPRRDHFEPPGPRLRREDHPELFAMIDDIAQRTGQELPRDVYAELDVNAWVAERGGVMGAGSRRVMALGLPLMRALTVSELRAVLAHEFGHFHGGDTKLGTWIYKTRSAIGNTLASLSDSLLQVVFHWYGKMFLRITQSISRQQEYDADALAAEVVGPQHLAAGLRKVHGAAVAFRPYLDSEFAPAAEQGYLPPLAEGFARFLAHGRISGLVRDEITRELESPRQDAYDSHPPLAHRVAALREMPESTEPPDERPAIVLLSDVSQVERDICGFVLGRRAAAELKAIEWDQITEQVYVPQWRRVRDEARKALAGCLADAPPASATALRDLGKRLLAPRVPPSPDVAIGYAHHALGCALATLLVERGLAPECGIGESIAFTQGDARIEPFGDLQRLASRELDADTWRSTCERFGIAGRALDGSA